MSKQKRAIVTEQLYSIRDNQAKIFYKPQLYKTETDAIRMLARAVSDPKLQLSYYPQEFDLYYIGDWSEETGKITSLETPKFVVSASKFTEGEKNEQKN